MRKPYIAGNWKMNLTPSQAVKLAKELVVATKNIDTKVMIAPTFVCLPGVAEAVKGSKIIVAAQNVNDHDNGAYTGEISCDMLKDIGVNTVIIGHSERRSYFGDTDEWISKKIRKALDKGMDVDLCVGETLEQREAGKLEEVLKTQINEGLKLVKEEEMSHVTLAYEPIWAIGTGKTATPEDANNAHCYIRGLIEKLFGSDVAKNQIIQYGGSVKPSNVKELLSCEHIDGALVGGASLSAEKFIPIIKCGLE